MSTKDDATVARFVDEAHEVYLAVAQGGPPMPSLQAGAFERYVAAALNRARDVALEEAAILADSEQARCAREAARRTFEARDVWHGREEQASDLAISIRALKTGGAS